MPMYRLAATASYNLLLSTVSVGNCTLFWKIWCITTKLTTSVKKLGTIIQLTLTLLGAPLKHIISLLQPFSWIPSLPIVLSPHRKLFTPDDQPYDWNCLWTITNQKDGHINSMIGMSIESIKNTHIGTIILIQAPMWSVSIALRDLNDSGSYAQNFQQSVQYLLSSCLLNQPKMFAHSPHGSMANQPKITQ